MQSLTDLGAGKFLGRYELLMPVAQGGMAAVWAARLLGTRGFQRVVAIKTILPNLSDDVHFELMFLDEAGLAARVRHPNVVQILDLGEENGLLYQVMEWIDGESLTSFLRDSKAAEGLPLEIAARIMIGVCEGLHAAHEARDDAEQIVGLVHRDVSPQNILITRDGVPKVVDFGVAKANSLSSAHTVAGTLKGKPAYMAPEQVRGEDVDRRADIFSLGVVLYLTMTGFNPFRGANDLATMHKIVDPEPPPKPSTLRTGDAFPEELDAVILRAVEKDPRRRFPTAAAMARAIEQAVPEVRKTGDTEVAAFMRGLLGPRLDARAASLRQALADADQRASVPGSPRRSLEPGTPSSPEITSKLTFDRVSVTAPGGFAKSLTPDATQPITARPPPLQRSLAPAPIAPARIVSSDPVVTGTDSATVAAVDAPKASSAKRIAAIAGVGALMTLSAAGVFFYTKSREAPAPLPASSLAAATTSAPVVPSAIPSSSSTSIAAESLPTATSPVTPRDTAVDRSDAGTSPRARESVDASTAEASTAPPATSGSKIRGTVPTIRDPGF